MDKERCQCGKSGKFRLLLLLILGFLMGVMMKSIAMENISVGYDDPKVKAYEQGYDFDQISKDVEAKKMNAEMSGEGE